MPKASYQQPNFLGGEWSPVFQGRVDNPRYKTAMNLSSNGYPTEEGAWTKRSGFRFIGQTDLGKPARLFPFSVNEDTPFTVELTDGIMRIHAGDKLVTNGSAQVLAVYQSTPALLTVASGGYGWTSGNTIVVTPNAGTPGYAWGGLFNQTLLLTEVAVGWFELSDPPTLAPIDGSQIVLPSSNGALASLVLRFVTPYVNGDWYNVKTTMVGSTMFFFHPNYPPQMLSLVGQPAGVNTVFTFTQPQLIDGPYLPQVGNGTDTGQSFAWTGYGTTTLHASDLSTGFGPNQPNGITSADIGRSIRILSEPQPWVAITVYPSGTPVTLESESGNEYYRAIGVSSVPAGNIPNLHPEFWALDPSLAFWAWGTIATVTDTATFTVTMVTQMKYNIPNPVLSFQVGLLGDPVFRYPVCGCFHEGRLWMFGENYINGSTTSDPTGLTWSPTLPDETVTDASGITYQLEAGDDNSSTLLWGISNQQGIVLGTNGGEWLLQASALNDPITPTSIQAHRVTKYRCSYVKPVQTPLSIVFVQRFQRKVMEFLQDVFTGRYVAPNLTTAAKHLTTSGVEEVVYQEEITPIVWVRGLDKSLKGITYRRQSSFPSEEPIFTGWHRHIHGEGYTFVSLAMAPGGGASTLLDYLYTVTGNASISGTYRVERMVKSFDVNDGELSSFFLDGGVVPCGMLGDPTTGVTIYGVFAHAGKTVTVMLGGVDMGTFAVNAAGNVFVPYNSIVTAAYLEGLTGDFGEAGAPLTISTTTVSTPSAWSSGTSYPVGAVVSSGGLDYVSLNCYNTGNATSTDFWAAVTVPTAFTVWNNATAYAQYSFVTVTGGAVYVALNANTNEYPASQAGCDWAQVSGIAVTTTLTQYTVPCVVGFDFSPSCQGQLLRPGSAQEAGAANGPPQGKKRRTNQYAALFQSSQAVKVGTDFTNMNAVTFAAPGGAPYTVTQLFSGTVWDTLSDDFSYDSMLSWQSTGPYPLTIVSISGFLETQDY
jgi:hypothetical protein